jgi:hypothetical protein
MTLMHVAEHDGGWLVSGEDAPIGFIGEGGGIVTPSGAAYTVLGTGETAALMSADGSALATLNAGVLRDETSGVEWRVRAGWDAGAKQSKSIEDDIWAAPYTLEDAQSTVPNRVRLLLAWIVTR